MLQSPKSLKECLNNPEKYAKLREWSEKYYQNVPGGLEGCLETREGNPYLLWDTAPITVQMADALRLAGHKTYTAIRAGLVALMQSSELLYNEYQMPEDYLALGLADDVPIGDMRLDLSIDAQAYYDNINHGTPILPHHIKVIEWNSETPSFMWESGSGQNLITDALGGISPNLHGRDWSLQMGRDFTTYVEAICKARKIDPSKTPLYFSYPGDEASGFVHEDNLSFFERIGQYETASGYPARFRFFQDLILDADGLVEGMFDAVDGDPVKLLFSHFPYEMLIEEDGIIAFAQFPELVGESISPARYWDYFLQAILEKKVTKLPGTQAAYAQNKGFYAFLYESMLEGKWDEGDGEIANIIRTHLLPTFCTPEFAHEFGMWLGQRFYEKPIYGREGAGIYAFDTHPSDPEQFTMVMDTFKHDGEVDAWYEDQPAIYQHAGELPEIQYTDGKLTLMFTVYVSALGQGCLLGCRGHAQSELTAINPESGIWVPLAIQE
jgi:glutathionylspermidine synthase